MRFRKLLCIAAIIHAIPCQANLLGEITNSYNIRDDILSYIQSLVPPVTARAKYAIIKIAQNQQNLYYRARSYAEASKIMESSSIARRCLTMERPKDDYQIFKTINNMMIDTKERKEHAMNTCAQFFGGAGFDSVRLSKNELMQRCDAKDY